MNKYEVRQQRLRKALGLEDNPDWEDVMREYMLNCTQWTSDCIDSYYFGADVESPCSKKTQYATVARFTARRMIKERMFKAWRKTRN